MSAPIGLLGTLATDTYEVVKRHADGKPWIVRFMRSVEVAGVPCNGEAWVNRMGGLIAITLSQDHAFGARRFGAGSFVRYHSSQQEGLIADVKLGTDQEVDGLPCNAGTLVMFDRKQRLRSLTLGVDRDIDGIPAAQGSFVEFQSGCVSGVRLAREHLFGGRRLPRGTWVYLVAGRLRRAMLSQDWYIDGVLVQAGSAIELDGNGHVISVQRHISPPGTL